MTQQEEILMRMGIDQKPLLAGLSGGLAKLNEFGREGEKSFLHAGSAGRAFHKLLENITEQSPLMGNALRFAISPIVGTITIAVAVFASFNRMLEETARRMDAIAEANAKGRDLRQESATIVEREIDAMREMMRFDDERADKAKERMEALQAESSLMEDQAVAQAHLAKLAGERADAEFRYQAKAKEFFQQIPIATKAENQLRELKSRMDEAIEKSRKLNAEAASARGSGVIGTISQGLKELQGVIAGTDKPGVWPVERLAAEASHQAQAAIDAYEHARKLLAPAVSLMQDQKTYMDQAKGKFERLNAAVEAFTKSLAQREIEIRNRFLPTQAELARAPGVFGYAASEIQAAQESAKMAHGQGNFGENIRAQMDIEAAQFALRGDLMMAGGGADRSKAFERYADRLRPLIEGRSQSDSHVAEINQRVEEIMTTLKGTLKTQAVNSP